VDVGATLKRGFSLFLQDVLPLVVGALLTLVLGALSVGILGGPMLAGLYSMVLRRVREGRTPAIGDVFSRFDRFGAYLLAFYGLGILTAIGFALLVVPGLYLTAIWLYVFPVLIDRPLGVGQAMDESRRMVDRAGTGAHFGLALVLVVISAVLCAAGGGILSWLGPLVALPFFVTTSIAAYQGVARAGSGPASLPETTQAG